MTRNTLFTTAMGTALIMAGSASAAVLGTYEFTGGSLAVTDADAGDGVTMSDFSIGTGFGDLFDNGSDGNFLSIAGNDNAPNGTGASITADTVLSFTVTNNSGNDLVLSSLSYDVAATNVFQFANGRLFTSIPPTSAVDETVGRVGATSGGDIDPIENRAIDLTDGSADFGSAVDSATFTIADGQSLTFYVPWADNSSSDGRYVDLDNLALSGDVVPEPGSLALLGLGGLLIARRRRD